MKVLVFSLNFPNAEAQSQGVFVKERIKNLAKQCDIKVVSPIPYFPFLRYIKHHAPRDVPKVELIDGLEVNHPRFFYVPGLFKSLDGFFLFLSSIIVVHRIRRHFRFDLIDAHFAYPDGFAAALLAKIYRVPLTITLRGTIVTQSKYFWRRSFICWALHNAQKIFSVAHFLKKCAINLGIDGKKIIVVPNGVDKTEFNYLGLRASRKKLQIPDECKVIVSIGGLTERKGFHRVIELLPGIMADLGHERLLYIIIGGVNAEGDYSLILKDQIASLHLEQNVWMVGLKAHDDLAVWLSSADLFCLATRNEGCANVILEALACGLPVVTTDVGGNREIVSSEELGIIVDFGDRKALKDAIQISLNKYWNRDKIIEYSQNYSWNNVSETILDTYRNMLNG